MIKSLENNINEGNQDNEIKVKRSKRLYIIIFIYLYSFFALQRIEKIMSFMIDGNAITNQLWIIPLLCIFSFFLLKQKKFSGNRYNNYIVICLHVYILVMLIGGFNVTSVGQYIVAILYFFLPISFYFITSKLTIKDIQLLLKIIILTSLFYAVFIVALTKNYTFFIKLVGIPIDQNVNLLQNRPNTMFGSSISVSYYFNLILPLLFYLYYTCINKKWRNILTLAIISNISATFILLSRAAALCTILNIVGILLFVRKNKDNKGTNILLFLLLIIAGIFIVRNYNLSRLLIGFNRNTSSVSARLTAGNLGLYIFSKKPLFGSGIGEYFNRIYRYEDRMISVDGFIGLIDPHNMYILALSETGMVGFILLITLFILLFKNFSRIKEKELRWASYISIFAFLFDSMGGSHLFNEMSFSNVFWIYMGIMNVFILKDKNEPLL